MIRSVRNRGRLGNSIQEGGGGARVFDTDHTPTGVELKYMVAVQPP